MKLDVDIKLMSLERRGYELQRLRGLLRSHKKKRGHARCWLNDANLYDLTLPEGSDGMGRMDVPEEVLFKRCKRYIRDQQCKVHCSLKPRRV
jgi:hypothetical protein